MRKQRVISLLCLCLSLLLTMSLAACKETDEQNSDQPTASIQPTAAPTPTPPPIPYTDVAVDAPYYDAVVWAYKNGIASDGETFGPADACTRGQVITFLWRAKGSPEPQAMESPFRDVSASDWFYKPALWASENGIATGTAFNPGNPCTNGEALTFLWRAEGKPMAVAASDAYYARPLSWAETNGQFAGADFDPAAPCTRADLMSCLYWAEVQWTSAEEVRALQAEYEQIISQQKIYEVHGSGLCYADYVDVGNDGKVELLTVGLDNDLLITAVVYANVNGHAEKYCEGTFKTAYFGKFGSFSAGMTADGHPYVCSAGGTVEMAGAYYNGTSQFFKVGKGTFSLESDLYYEEEYNVEKEITEYTYFVSGKEATKDEYERILKKYPNSSTIPICSLDFGNPAILNRGLLSAPQIEVNGSAVKLSAEPYLDRYDNVFMVPLRDVLEAMGVAVYANPDASVILASTKSDTLVISRGGNFRWSSYSGINSRYYGENKTYKYSMNGGGQNITVEFTDGKAFAPFQTIVSLFGAKAEWNGAAGAIQIDFDLPDSSRMSQDELKKLVNFDLEQASQLAISKGHKGSNMMNGTVSLFEYAFSFDSEKDMPSGLRFINGKAVWTLYAIEREDKQQYGYYAELYRVDIASDGNVTAYPNERGYMGAGQT